MDIFIYLIVILVIIVIVFTATKHLLNRNFRSRTGSEESLTKISSGVNLTNVQVDDLFNNNEVLKSISDNNYEYLNTIFGGTINNGIQSVSYIAEKNTYLVEFTKKGQELLDTRKAEFAFKGKKRIPELTVNGKYFEHATLSPKAKKTLSNLSKLSAIVVSTAHIISGADIAKKLDAIDKKVDFLIEDRKNELYAELEAILKQAIEIKMSAYSDDQIQEYRRLSKDIYKLRAHWRLNFESKLRKIENEHDSVWILKKFSIKTKGNDKKMVNKISECEENIHMIDASLNLQLILAEERGELPLFLNKVLPAEVKELRKTEELLRERAAFISGKYEKDGIDVSSSLNAINGVINKFQSMSIQYQLPETNNPDLIE